MNGVESFLSRCRGLGDGAMGTQLIARGLGIGHCPELWNVERPHEVLAVHQAYADAGCGYVTTNTFGGSAVALARHGLESRTTELNRAAVAIAKRTGVAVVGSVGPCAQMLEPYGDLTHEEAFEGFSVQCRALVEAGADALAIETMESLEEARLAVRAAREAGAAVVIASFAFGRGPSGFRTMMGVGVAEAMTLDADVIGSNCGAQLSLDDVVQLAAELVAAADGRPVIVRPNAGAPEAAQDGFVYRTTPAEMRAWSVEARAQGVRLVGGCCGTTPEHLRAMAGAVTASGTN